MEYFIEKVKLYPCLWKMNDISYRDIGKKDSVWKRIARECKMANAKEAKSLWKKLRDSHREALRRRKTSTGQATHNLKPWKYEALMDFLLKQKENNESSSNYSSSLQEISHGIENSLDTNTNNDVIELPTRPPESPRSTSSSHSGKKNSEQRETDTLQRRKKNREHIRFERDEARMRNIDSNRPRDALTDLFDSLCQKTCDLPKYLQLRVQREIFETVTRAEEEALSYDSKYSILGLPIP